MIWKLGWEEDVFGRRWKRLGIDFGWIRFWMELGVGVGLGEEMERLRWFVLIVIYIDFGLWICMIFRKILVLKGMSKRGFLFEIKIGKMWIDIIWYLIVFINNILGSYKIELLKTDNKLRKNWSIMWCFDHVVWVIRHLFEELFGIELKVLLLLLTPKYSICPTWPSNIVIV